MSLTKIYFEGDPALEGGFRQLLMRALPDRSLRDVTWHSGRAKAIDKFLTSLAVTPSETTLLLLDAEEPDEGALWQRLISRTEWKPASPVDPDQAYFMVQVMEAWFLADREFLARWYGQGFNAKALPANTQIEAISKADVLQGLKRATEKTQKGAYHKTLHAPMLLGGLDPVKLCQRSPHFERLLQRITGITG